jgi:4-amino-4-deoxy-L-arabinose transferase-like glycosyltransferase
VYLFLREALPAVPWAWTVGALGTALAPLLGFMSGAINPDALLFAMSAATFYLLARGFRRGLTPPLAMALGVAMAAGFLTKLNFIGVAPGAFLGLVLLTVRASGDSRAAALRCFALAAGIATSPLLLYLLANLASDKPALGIVSDVLTNHLSHGTLGGKFSYIWQLFLPHLPGMTNDFPEVFTARQYWFNGLIALYGWLDTQFPGWVYTLALIPAGLIALLCGRAIVSSRRAVRGRLTELITYVAMGIGLMALIGTDGYFTFPGETATYSETRYLFPLLALYGAVFALAARGAGRRWGPIVGTLIVVIALAHDLVSQLLVVARYYS